MFIVLHVTIVSRLTECPTIDDPIFVTVIAETITCETAAFETAMFEAATTPTRSAEVTQTNIVQAPEPMTTSIDDTVPLIIGTAVTMMQET